MFKRVFVILLVSFGVFVWTGVVNAESGTAEKTEKREDLKKLLRLTKSDQLAIQMMDGFLKSVIEYNPDIPEEVLHEFIATIDKNELIEVSIPAYDKHFSHEEIKELIVFYSSPIGVKIIEKLPLVIQDSMRDGEEWGRKVGEKFITKLKEEGYLQEEEGHLQE